MKRFLGLVLSFTVFLSFFAGFSYAQGNSSDEIPEKDGVYDDPLHPGIKVRVFVHKERPTLTINPSLACGLADPDSTFQDAPTGWKLPSSWTYNLNTSSVPAGVGSDNLPVFAGIAFSNWSSAVGSKVAFTRGSDTQANRQAYDGQNIVAWGRTSGSALAVTYTRYNSTTKQVVDVDTIMNNKFTWAWSSQAQCAYQGLYDAQNILTHELGHWMGLNDHYTADYVNNTMYGYGSKGEVKKDTLTTGDISGVSAIYQ